MRPLLLAIFLVAVVAPAFPSEDVPEASPAAVESQAPILKQSASVAPTPATFRSDGSWVSTLNAWSGLISLFVLIIYVFQAWLMQRTLRATIRSADATVVAADATRASTEALLDSRRPRIFVEPDEPPDFSGSTEMSLDFFVVNLGGSPAWVGQRCFDLQFVSRGSNVREPKVLFEHIIWLPMIHVDPSERKRHGRLLFPATDEEFRRFQRGQLDILFSSLVYCEDAVGVRHMSLAKWCFVYNIDNHGLLHCDVVRGSTSDFFGRV